MVRWVRRTCRIRRSCGRWSGTEEPVVEHELVPVHMIDGGFGHDGDRARDGGVQSRSERERGSPAAG